MSIARSLLRTALPPVLALGLAVVVVHPLDAAASAAAGASAPDPVAAELLGDRVATTEHPTNGGGLATAVPVVAFQDHAMLAGGRLRTAVLVNVSATSGTATIDGLAGCSTEVAPGVPAWLDCADAHPGRTVAVRVVLADGRAFAQTALPVVG